MSESNNLATSVLLPTVKPVDVIDELLEQLSEDDELIVICDSEDDAVAKTNIESDKFELVVAGEPKGCFGKANAIYHGMKAAENNRVVWTDEDFHHPENWLEKLHEECNEHGPVSELPFFIGKNPLTIINEPTYALGACS